MCRLPPLLLNFTYLDRSINRTTWDVPTKETARGGISRPCAARTWSSWNERHGSQSARSSYQPYSWVYCVSFGHSCRSSTHPWQIYWSINTLFTPLFATMCTAAASGRPPSGSTTPTTPLTLSRASWCTMTTGRRTPSSLAVNKNAKIERSCARQPSFRSSIRLSAILTTLCVLKWNKVKMK